MLVGISGVARAGKDVASRYLVEKHGFERIAFADGIKEALYELNPIVGAIGLPGVSLKQLIHLSDWEYAKDYSPEVRRLLQRMGTEVGRKMWGEDFWVDAAIKKIPAGGGRVVFSDVRHVNEADAIRKLGGVIWKIDRKGVGPLNDHESENALADYKFDAVIVNNDTIEELHHRIEELVQRYVIRS